MSDQILADNQLRHCKACNEWKSLELFHRQPLAKGGRRSQCGKCTNKITYQYRKKNDISRRFKVRYSFARANARTRKKPFLITFPEYEFVIEKPCFYCDGYFEKVKVCSGLDRIDNSRGYELMNVLPCCGTCNRMRGAEFSVEEARLMIQTAIAVREKRGVRI